MMLALALLHFTPAEIPEMLLYLAVGFVSGIAYKKYVSKQT